MLGSSPSPQHILETLSRQYTTAALQFTSLSFFFFWNYYPLLPAVQGMKRIVSFLIFLISLTRSLLILLFSENVFFFLENQFLFYWVFNCLCIFRVIDFHLILYCFSSAYFELHLLFIFQFLKVKAEVTNLWLFFFLFFFYYRHVVHEFSSNYTFVC